MTLDKIGTDRVVEEVEGASEDPLRTLVDRRANMNALQDPTTIVIGELVGIVAISHTPLVTYYGQPGSAAVAARSVVDLRSAHVGKSVVLILEGADRDSPIVIGVLRGVEGSTPANGLAMAEVEADGERLVVTAKEQLVLRCGKSSITLTRDGKVLIEGAHVSTHASGVNRIKGGSVQIN